MGMTHTNCHEIKVTIVDGFFSITCAKERYVCSCSVVVIVFFIEMRFLMDRRTCDNFSGARNAPDSDLLTISVINGDIMFQVFLTMCAGAGSSKHLLEEQNIKLRYTIKHIFQNLYHIFFKRKPTKQSKVRLTN